VIRSKPPIWSSRPVRLKKIIKEDQRKWDEYIFSMSIMVRRSSRR